MKILLLAVGRRHDPAISAAINDYTARIDRVADVEWCIVSAAPGKTTPAEAQRTESQALAAKCKPHDYVILLDERGKQLSSPALAELVGQQQQSAQRLVFVIGGAYGVDEALASRANMVWSLSQLVFPHQLVRLVLTEQLYRAFTILRGEPYHHQ